MTLTESFERVMDCIATVEAAKAKLQLELERHDKLLAEQTPNNIRGQLRGRTSRREIGKESNAVAR